MLDIYGFILKKYSVFKILVKISNGALVLGLSQFLLLTQLPYKKDADKMVRRGK
jgi:hypothetical protein